MTTKEQKAKAVSIDVWTYFFEHPRIFTKKCLPEDLFEEIEDDKANCPLCELFDNRIMECRGCPLSTADNRCYRYNSLWDQWQYAKWDDEKTRESAAFGILEIIKNWEIEEDK